jgi:hypothetical protein
MSGPKDASHSMARLRHVTLGDDDDVVRQQPLYLKSVRNTTPPVQPHVGTGIYHMGNVKKLLHTM